MCKKLDKALIKFKNLVLDKIDRFEGNIFTSNMIPIVVRLQTRFRDIRKQKMLLELREKHLDTSEDTHSNEIIRKRIKNPTWRS